MESRLPLLSQMVSAVHTARLFRSVRDFPLMLESVLVVFNDRDGFCI